MERKSRKNNKRAFVLRVGQKHRKSFHRIMSWGQKNPENKNNKLIDKLTRKATFLTFLIPRINTQGGIRTGLAVLRHHWKRLGLVQARDFVLVAVVDGLVQASRGVRKSVGETEERALKSKADTHLNLQSLCFFLFHAFYTTAVLTQSKLH